MPLIRNTKISELREDHPFSEYVRILGRGKSGSRSLTQTEAYEAMSMILSGAADEAQIGAFLMLLRVKEETAEELAGFVAATRNQIQAPQIAVDVDWSSYAGKKNQLPWSLLAAKLLAANGIKVFIHGADGTQKNRLYTEAAANAVDIPVCVDWLNAENAIETHNICFMPMRAMSTSFYELLFYRRLFGLRSAMHSTARLVNPLNAALTLQGVFHPAYGPSHQTAAALLNQSCSAAFKGEGGEAEIRPDAATKISFNRFGVSDTVVWPKQLKAKADKLTFLNVDTLNTVWRGDTTNLYGEAAVISSTALVLWLQEKALTPESAHSKAQELWLNRH